MQALTKVEEKAIVRWYSKLDEWGHPPRLALVESTAQTIVQRRDKEQQIGKHWLSCFLKQQPELASQVSTRLDLQQSFASDPKVIKDYFYKVFDLY